MSEQSGAKATETLYTDDPASLLWDYAYSISDIRGAQEQWLQDRFDILSGQDVSNLNLHEREVRATQEGEYHDGYAQLQNTIADEEAAMTLLERIEAGEDISNEEILGSIPTEFIEQKKAQEEAKEAAERKAIEDKQAVPALLGFRFRSYGMPSIPWYDHETSREDTAAGRLTSGRNRTRLKVGAKGLGAFDAKHAFFHATTDTHGGKVRRPGKGSNSYASKSGRRVRKK
jgi:hypothetical protein